MLCQDCQHTGGLQNIDMVSVGTVITVDSLHGVAVGSELAQKDICI